MAKDREKLFKDLDDKNISFQRAVFIVCNLKRLIKRPKKDDKHSSTGSRKRSSGQQDDESLDGCTGDGSGGGAGAGLESRRGDRHAGEMGGAGAGQAGRAAGRHKGFRDPVRRAFTLPTMLCNTFAVVAPAAPSPALAAQLAATAGQLAPSPQQELTAPEDCASAAPTDWFSRRVFVAPPTQAVGVSPPKQNSPLLLAEPAAAAVSRPLSYLVTPIRRANQHHPSQGHHQRQRSPLASPSNFSDTSSRGSVSSSRHQQHRQVCCPVWDLVMRQLDARQQQPRDQQQYAHIMGPPSSQSYLLAPRQPAAAGRRQSGQQDDDDDGETSDTSRSGSSSSSCSMMNFDHRRRRHHHQGQPRRPSSCSSGSTQPSRSSSPCSSCQEEEEESRGHGRRRGDKQAPPVPPPPAKYRRSSGGDAQITASASAADRQAGANSSAAAPSSRQSSSPRSELAQCGQRQQRKTTRDRIAQRKDEQMRMKRFSSALCLAAADGNAAAKQRQQVDQQSSGVLQVLAPCAAGAQQSVRRETTAQSTSSSTKPKADKKNKSSSSSSKKKKKQQHDVPKVELTPSTTTATATTTTTAMIDPMILARQRRPSVCNQASVNVDQQALFSAVECNQLDRARTLLETGRADVNSLNGDKLTCLDIAVLLRHFEMVRLLQQRNAKESSAYLTYEGRANQLYALYAEARRLVEDLSRSLEAMNGPGGAEAAPPADEQQPAQESSASGAVGPLMLATGSLLSSALFEEKQRQLQYWKRRLDLFMHMRYEFERLHLPGAPELVVLQVVGETSLGVKILHSLRTSAGCGSSALVEAQSLSGDQRPKPEAGQCSDANCSHWTILAADRKLSTTTVGTNNSPPPPKLQLSDNVAAQRQRTTLLANDEQQQLTKQQKLAVFDQLLAHQLELLSSQQRGLRHQQQLDQLRAKQMRQAATTSSQNPRRPLAAGLLRLTAVQNVSTDSAATNYWQQQQQQAEPAAPEQPTTCQPAAMQPALAACIVGSAGLAAQVTPLVNPTSCPSSAAAAAAAAAEAGVVTKAAAEPGSLVYKIMTGGAPAGSGGPVDRRQRHLAAADELNSRGGQDDYLTVITKYKIEWSESAHMQPIAGSMIVYNNNNCPLECQIEGLSNGRLYYVQVSSGNHRGFSAACSTSPRCLAPSSWRQVDGNKRRKYSEEVFRKFTKLILLNKHILDDHESLSAAKQSSLLLSSSSSAATSGSLLCVNQTSASASANANATNQSNNNNNNNKSSLINMLLLDAIAPAGEPALGNRRNSPHEDGANRKRSAAATGEQPAGQQQSLSVRKNLKSFFQSNAFKFHKLSNQNKRGLYLCTVIYNLPPSETTSQNSACPQFVVGGAAATNTRVVVTNDDRLPVIEILNDLVAPGALMSDFYWLLKISGTQWMDIKRLRQQLQKSHSSSTLHLRIKLLAAIEQMQLALNIEDIGRIFYKPIQAHDGSIVICTCRQVANTKTVSNLSIKWTSQHKIIPRHLRKISDSMLINQQQQQQQQQQPPPPPQTRGRRSELTALAAGATILPGTTMGSNVSSVSKSSLQATAANEWQQQQQQTSERARSDAFIVSSTTGEHLQPAKGGAEFKLCEHCQYNLIQRRSTMASGSSSSSLASSSDNSQWSSASNNQLPPPGGTSRCTCNRTSGGVGGGSHLQLQLQPGLQTHQQARSASTASTTLGGTSQSSGAATIRSGSMATPTPETARHSSASASAAQTGQAASRPSQAPPTFSAAQKSSTYLMLASLSLYDLLLFTMNEIIHFDRASIVPLNRGLYLGFVQLQTTVESMRLLVPRSRPNMVPCARIRDNAHVSREEWQLLKRFGVPTNQISAAGSGGRAKPSTDRGTRKPRISDPSIWSLESTFQENSSSQPAPPAPESGAGSLASLAATSTLAVAGGGFDRSRAKSVSPGLIQANSSNNSGGRSAGQQAENCMQLSVSSEQIVSADPTKQISSHSDTDLRSSRQHHRSSVASCGANSGDSQAQQTINNSPSEPNGLDDEEVKTSGRAAAAQLARSAISASRLTVNSYGSQHHHQQQQCQQATPEETFVRLVGSAARRLLNELKSELPKVYDERQDRMVSILQSLNDDENNRIYHLELIELNAQVTFILLIPSAENVCPVTSHEKSNILGDNQDYMLLALQIFETIHIRTYEPELLGKYSRLSAILETDLIVAQHEHRQAFSSNELKSTKSRVGHLQDMVSIADEFWRQLRWIVDVVSFARDKSSSSCSSSSAAAAAIRLGSIWRHFELWPSVSIGELPNLMNLPAAAAAQPPLQKPQQQQQQQRLRKEVQRTSSARAGRDSHSDKGRERGRENGAGSSNSTSTKTTTANSDTKLSVVDSVPEIHLTSHSSIVSTASSSSSSYSVSSSASASTSTSASSASSTTRTSSCSTTDSTHRGQVTTVVSSQQSRRNNNNNSAKQQEYITKSSTTKADKRPPANKCCQIGAAAAADTKQQPPRSRSLSKYCDESVYKLSSCSAKTVQCEAIFSAHRPSPSSAVTLREVGLVKVEQIREDADFNSGSSSSKPPKSKHATEGSRRAAEKTTRETSAAAPAPTRVSASAIVDVFRLRNRSSSSETAAAEAKQTEDAAEQEQDEEEEEESEDENAIYAYHISLRDATRAAAERKSSQLSTRPILYARCDSHQMPAAPATDQQSQDDAQGSAATTTEASPTTTTTTPKTNERSHGEEGKQTAAETEATKNLQTDSRTTDRECFWALPAAPSTSGKPAQGATSRVAALAPAKRGTNPFLTDSFDLSPSSPS